MKCVICGIELSEGTMICRACGFDMSSCVELYPTFVRIIGAQKTLSQRKKEELERQTLTFPKEFVVNKDGALMKYTGSAETVVIPDGIKSIRKAFSSNKTVRKVILPESVTRIGADAFSWSSLQTIELPKGLTVIGNSAFSYSQLTSISLPEKLKTIGEYAFSNTRLQEISVPGKTSKISYKAFSECKELEVVRIETGVKELGEEAFSHCPKLKTIYIPDTVEKIDGKTFECTEIQTAYASDAWKRANPELLRKMVPDPIEEKNYEIEGTKLIHYYGRATEPQIPAQVTTIGREAFSYNSHITKIVIPEHVTAIEFSAFSWCENLREVILPDHITEIGSFTFGGCNNLFSVRFPQKLQVIGASAFWRTGIHSLILPSTVSKLESKCFETCTELSEVHIPDSLETIEKNKYSGKYDTFDIRFVKVFYASRTWAQKHQDFLKAYPNVEIRYQEAKRPQEEEIKLSSTKDFEVSGTTLIRYKGNSEIVNVPYGITAIGEKALAEDRSIRKVVLPNTVRTIQENAFYNSGLEEISLPEGLITVAKGAFFWTNLQNLQLPQSICSIGVKSFSGSKLASISLPGSIQAIPESAFERCKSLKTVIIGAGIKSLGARAFASCPALESVEIPDSLTEICTVPGKGSFVESNGINTVVSSDSWRDANPKLLREMIPDPNEEKNFVTRDHVLIRYYGRAAEPVIPSHVTVIGEYAFYGNEHIRKIVIPEGITSVADSAFCYCRNLSDVSFPSTLHSVASWSFAGTGISRLDLPQQLSTIKQYAFDSCDRLTVISFPDSLQNIEEEAFDRLKTREIKRIYASKQWAKEHRFFLSCFSNAVIVNSPDAFASPAFSIGDLFFQIEGQKLIRYLGKDYHVIIPDGITEIGARAFADDRDLQHIELPKSVTKIGENAFSNCSNLSSLVLPEGVQSIGKGAFSGSGIEMLKIPDGVRIIHERLCENCSKLFAVVLPKNITKVEPFAFSGCNQIVSAFDPVVLMNFRNVQILEGNECLMRGVLKSVKSIDTYLFAISLNVGMIDLSRYTPYYFLCDADDTFAEKLAKASKSYVGNLAPDERPILLFDDSMFGSGKSGFVITTRRIYCKQLWDKRSYPLSQLIGFARQEDRFGFAVKNGERPFLPFSSKAKSADAAQKIIEALDAACNWLKILNEPT